MNNGNIQRYIVIFFTININGVLISIIGKHDYKKSKKEVKSMKDKADMKSSALGITVIFKLFIVIVQYLRHLLKLLSGMTSLNFSCIYIINMLIYITHWINSKWKLLKTYSAYTLYFYQNHTVPLAYNIYAFSDTLSIDFFYIIFQEIIMILAALFALVVGIYMFLFWQLSWNEEPATLILSDGYSDIFVVC